MLEQRDQHRLDHPQIEESCKSWRIGTSIGWPGAGTAKGSGGVTGREHGSGCGVGQCHEGGGGLSPGPSDLTHHIEE